MRERRPPDTMKAASPTAGGGGYRPRWLPRSPRALLRTRATRSAIARGRAHRSRRAVATGCTECRRPAGSAAQRRADLVIAGFFRSRRRDPGRSVRRGSLPRGARQLAALGRSTGGDSSLLGPLDGFRRRRRGRRRIPPRPAAVRSLPQSRDSRPDGSRSFRATGVRRTGPLKTSSGAAQSEHVCEFDVRHDPAPVGESDATTNRSLSLSLWERAGERVRPHMTAIRRHALSPLETPGFRAPPPAGQSETRRARRGRGMPAYPVCRIASVIRGGAPPSVVAATARGRRRARCPAFSSDAAACLGAVPGSWQRREGHR
jgi:hypothetical protein